MTKFKATYSSQKLQWRIGDIISKLIGEEKIGFTTILK